MKIKEEKMNLFRNAGIYLVSSQELSDYPTLHLLDSFLKNGGKLFQLREKTLSKKELYELAMKVREMTLKHSALFIVNDHLDIAKLCSADGVHLGTEDLPIGEARKLLGEDFIIGASTHCVNDLVKVKEQGADYVNIGPVFNTQTKPGVQALSGAQIQSIIEKLDGMPFTFMGGIKEADVRTLLEYKPSALAMITEITKAKDLEGKLKKLFALLNI